MSSQGVPRRSPSPQHEETAVASRHDEHVRVISGIVLLIVATAVGLFCPFAFAETGLDWTFSKPATVLEDSFQWDSERSFSVQFGVTALIVWFVLSTSAFFILLFGPSRRHPVLAGVLVSASAVIVLGLTAAALSIPPAGEPYPLPPWNRA